MSFDSKGQTVSIGDEVVCFQRSIIIVPVATSGERKPLRNGKKYVYDPKMSSDENRRRSFQETLNDCVLHRDVILEKADYQKGFRSPVLTVTAISGDHATFSGNDSELKHYHPLSKFTKIMRKKI